MGKENRRGELGRNWEIDGGGCEGEGARGRIRKEKERKQKIDGR